MASSVRGTGLFVVSSLGNVFDNITPVRCATPPVPTAKAVWRLFFGDQKTGRHPKSATTIEQGGSVCGYSLVSRLLPEPGRGLQGNGPRGRFCFAENKAEATGAEVHHSSHTWGGASDKACLNNELRGGGRTAQSSSAIDLASASHCAALLLVEALATGECRDVGQGHQSGGRGFFFFFFFRHQIGSVHMGDTITYEY